jgi:hypothetical protein
MHIFTAKEIKRGFKSCARLVVNFTVSTEHITEETLMIYNVLHLCLKSYDLNKCPTSANNLLMRFEEFAIKQGVLKTAPVGTETRRSKNWRLIYYTHCSAQMLINKL